MFSAHRKTHKFCLDLLVSPHIVCEGLSAMQDLEFVLKISRILYSWQIMNTPPPHAHTHTHAHTGLELYMEDLGSLDLRLPRITPPPQMKTVQDFGFEVTKNTPLHNENLCTWSWCVEINRCIPHGYHLVCYSPPA